ncbi:MAG: hypothetical protein KF784_02115 [Fimbriimonadaceae bacterium]|nr:hypothetical protein [Fimbriimonadaceae bacterium]
MLTVAIAMLAFSAPPTQGPTLVLYRGAHISGQPLRYWDVTDTTLNTLEPEKLFGGMQTVPVGSGKAFLIRYGDLRRVIGPNKKIVKANLRLAYWGTQAPALREAGVLLAPWGEGPLDVQAPWAQPALKPGEKPKPVQWASNWRFRRTGENSSSWQSPGAQGPRDFRQIPDARQSQPDKDQILITGLEEAVQSQYDRPGTNFGFVLRFDGVNEVSSSQSSDSRPRLELEIIDAPSPSKGDLSITHIEFSPQPAGKTETRTTEQTADQDGHPVAIQTAAKQARPWPNDGEAMTVTAYVKNVGEAPISGYTFNWWTREQPGIVSESAREIKPGETVKVTTQVPFRSYHTDHRINPIGLHIKAKNEEKTEANNALSVQLNALSLKVVMDQATYDALSKPNMLGSTSAEDYLQAHTEFINDSVFPNSVFATALEGVLERIRIQSIQVVADEAQANQASIDPTVDGVVMLIGFSSDPKQVSPELLRRMLTALGLPDLRSVTNTGTFGPAAPDVYGGLLGGDTRNNAYLPPQVLLSNKPAYDPFLDALFSENTDLLSCTHANLINDTLGKRNGFPAHPMLPLPGVVFLQFIDKGGKKLQDATLTFYQTAGGKLDENRVLATMRTDADGTVVVPKRTIGAEEPLITAGEQPMASNIFGRLDPQGRNGLIAIKVEANNQVDWAWIKGWQMADAARRTPGALIMSLRMNFSTTAIDTTTNVARNRIVTDSSGQSSADLAKLVDDDPSTSVTVGGKILDWIEIDLGRDRVVGELQLVGGSDAFWESFDIFVYATGQTAEQALPWSREKLWSWSFANAGASVTGGGRAVAYRGVAQRFRYIRIVNRTPSDKATLHEVRAYPIVREGG